MVMISAPDPEYGFKKKLDLKKHGETKKPVKLKCKVDDPNARVKWYKDGVEIKPSDADYLMEVDDEGNVTCEELVPPREGDEWWTLGEAEFSFKPSDAKHTKVDYDYEQRQIADRIANPHSEHAEEIFRLEFPDDR